MNQISDKGLTAIAASRRQAERATILAAAKPENDEKAPLRFEGVLKHTSVEFDRGLWNCVNDTAYLLTKHLRERGQPRVPYVSVLRAAFLAFRELPLEEQLELIRKQV